VRLWVFYRGDDQWYVKARTHAEAVAIWQAHVIAQGYEEDGVDPEPDTVTLVNEAPVLRANRLPADQPDAARRGRARTWYGGSPGGGKTDGLRIGKDGEAEATDKKG